MSLTVFTQNDVERLVFYLQLPPWELRAISKEASLYWRLDWVEQEDVRNGTNVAGMIQGWLDKLDTLDTAIDTELEEGQGAIAGQKKRVDQMYDQDTRFRSVAAGDVLAQLQGKQELYDKLIRYIKRYLCYLRFDNRIPLDGGPYPDTYNGYFYQRVLLLDA